MYCKLLLLLVLSSFILDGICVTTSGKEAIVKGKVQAKHDKASHQQHGRKQGTSHQSSAASKSHTHTQTQTQHHTQHQTQTAKKATHQAKTKVTTHQQVQTAIAEANQILQKHRHDDELVEILGHVWNTASRKDLTAMLSLLADHSLTPDDTSLNFRYRYTEDENSPHDVLLEAAARRKSALAFSSVLSRVADDQRSHIIEQTIWRSLTPATQARLYDMFDLNDQAAATLSDTFGCSPGEAVDANNHCYPTPSPTCVAPTFQYNAGLSTPICVTSCVTGKTCPSTKCTGQGYCDSVKSATQSDGGGGGHHSDAHRLVFSLSAVLLVVLLTVLQ